MTRTTMERRELRFALTGFGPGAHDFVLVAATERGVAWADIDADERSLRGRFLAWSEKRYPGAAAREVVPADDPVLAAAIARLGNPADAREVPLDESGTELQLLVWRALRAIHAGSRSSYAEIARSVGRPRAARAVANACAANHIAILIPCHRAVRSDGGLGGFRWGIPRKRALLELEAALSPTRPL